MGIARIEPADIERQQATGVAHHRHGFAQARIAAVADSAHFEKGIGHDSLIAGRTITATQVYE